MHATIVKEGWIFLLLLLLLGCKQAPQLPANQLPPNEENENLIILNKAIVTTEANQIVKYLHQHHLNMQKDSLGFWYAINKNGKGTLPVNGDLVTYQYTISLLNDQLCYSNYNTTSKSIILIGHSQSIRGIEMGLMKLRKGGEAQIIIPSIFGYSVIGDRHLIPPYAPLVIHLKLISLKHELQNKIIHNE